jgi:phage baseplate assembly protein W
MAVKIKNLESIANQYTTQQYVYKDLSLDLALTKIESPGFKLPVPGADIKADFDLGAINNSLTNLFNTLPGQRFLFPEYGLDLYQFLFSPVTEDNGDLIGNKIYQGILKYEPRVVPKRVKVIVDPDNNQYLITIAIEIPIIGLTTESQFMFDIKKQSFISLPTSRNK